MKSLKRLGEYHYEIPENEVDERCLYCKIFDYSTCPHYEIDKEENK